MAKYACLLEIKIVVEAESEENAQVKAALELCEQLQTEENIFVVWQESS